MKKVFPYIVTALLFFAIGYYFMLYSIPYIAINRVKAGLGEILETENVLLPAPLVDATSRRVVRPNPDFLYSIGLYDLSKHTLHISAKLPDTTYWSIAFYQDNTVNFFVQNDQDFQNGEINLHLVPKEQKVTIREHEQTVEAPTQKGVILIRILLPDRADHTVAAYQELQQKIKMLKRTY